jgi:hypothetical protein
VKRLLRDLPFFSDSQLFYFGPASARFVSIYHDQIPLRVSLPAFQGGRMGYTPAITSFPAVLDTGFNGGLVISLVHLREWAKLRPSSIGSRVRWSTHGPPLVRGFPAQAMESRLYIRPNRPGTWDDAGLKPIESPVRILVIDAPQESLRLPLLGMDALIQLGCLLSIDYRLRLVQASIV